MRKKHIAIFTHEDDFHTLVIHKALQDYHDVDCYIVETNRMCDNPSLNWSNLEPPDFRCTLPTREGLPVDVRSLDVIWWRRPYSPQQVPPDVTDPRHIDFINNECSTALAGILFTEFSGRWINHPVANSLAANKLYQLQVAQRAGIRTPRTLVSQDPARIRQFCAMLDNRVVVKQIRGTYQNQLYAGQLAEEYLAYDETLRLCPTIYQEYIPGKHHIRANCFGDDIYAVSIESEQLDWRGNLNVPFGVFDLPKKVVACLQGNLRSLGLEMGIVDLKLTEENEVVWLEINPQGQFLFVEGLAGLELTKYFSDFLYRSANND